MANTSPLPVVGQFQFYIVGDNRRSWAICHQHNLRSNTVPICSPLKPMDSIFDSTYQSPLTLRIELFSNDDLLGEIQIF